MTPNTPDIPPEGKKIDFPEEARNQSAEPPKPPEPEKIKMTMFEAKELYPRVTYAIRKACEHARELPIPGKHLGMMMTKVEEAMLWFNEGMGHLMTALEDQEKDQESRETPEGEKDAEST